MHAHQRLAAFRTEQGLSLSSLAVRLECTPQMLGYVERGEKVPGLAFAVAVENATIDWPPGPIRHADWLVVPLARKRQRARRAVRSARRRAA